MGLPLSSRRRIEGLVSASFGLTHKALQEAEYCCEDGLAEDLQLLLIEFARIQDSLLGRAYKARPKLKVELVRDAG